MTPHEQEWISKRAYALWEAQGRPNGRDAEHWRQAVEERAALQRSQASVDGGEVLVRLRPTQTSKPVAAIRHRRERLRKTATV